MKKSCKLASEKTTNCSLNSAPVMAANLENIHEIYNIFCQKNRMNADIINLFDRFSPFSEAEALEDGEAARHLGLSADSAAVPLQNVP